MKAGAQAALVAAALILAGCTTAPDRMHPALELAITIDDVPVHGALPPGMTANQVNAQMIAALKAADAPAFAFVNAVSVERQPETTAALQQWRDAGFPLGNHTWSHRPLSEISAEEFEVEVTKNEPVLVRPRQSSDWRWFRFPFLDQGESPAKRSAARSILAKHGYRVAAVTMSFSDWAFTAPYARCAAARDAAGMADIERMYLASVRDNMAIARDNTRKLHGRDIPYVLLMHVSALSAKLMPQIIKTHRDAGFRLVTLQQAQRDSAYRGYNDLRQPAPPTDAELARDKGVTLSAAPDYQARLSAMCAGPGRPTLPG